MGTLGKSLDCVRRRGLAHWICKGSFWKLVNPELGLDGLGCLGVGCGGTGNLD